ncbi:MAG: Tol-Pal system beta propeller repeat protein TolB [Candidatus Zixiibacteriota bacterium]|nr:MAG: Tol-Pal system beta propeller repeat protein TolB [candidate division Zixibacteria bacterium]
MKVKATLFLLIFCLTVPSISLAQANHARIRNIFFDTLMASGFEATPIGVDDMRFIGNQYITPDDSSIMRWVTQVVQRDINFYADFELIPLDSFFLQVYEITELDLLGWKRLGADLTVKLEAEFPGSNLRARWRLFDTQTAQQIAKGSFEYHKMYWREIAHNISDEIVHNLTGEVGIFRTKIVFAKKIGETKELFISDYDGANERQLTNNGSINISPFFSPDGNEVYFTSYLDGDPQLYKVQVDNGAVTRVANYPGLIAAPAVSPDGDKVACVLTKDGNSEIYVLDLDGRIIKRLTHHRAIESSPSWSPDSRSIVFSSDRTGRPQLYIMDADGLNIRRLTYEGGYNDSPIWSKRGNRITFVSRSKRGRFDIASIDTSGVDYRILTDVGMNENPHFCPGGKHIIFSSTRLGTCDLYTMDITGRNQRRLTRSGNCSNPVWGAAVR